MREHEVCDTIQRVYGHAWLRGRGRRRAILGHVVQNVRGLSHAERVDLQLLFKVLGHVCLALRRGPAPRGCHHGEVPEARSQETQKHRGPRRGGGVGEKAGAASRAPVGREGRVGAASRERAQRH